LLKSRHRGGAQKGPQPGANAPSPSGRGKRPNSFREMAMKTRVVPDLTLAAGLAAVVYIVVVVAAAAVGSLAVKAEPLLLTSSQMEAVTAGLAINVSPQIDVNAGNVAVVQQLNVTNQVATAVAAAAGAVATATNASLSGIVLQ
jgi:hypothetical protein